MPDSTSVKALERALVLLELLIDQGAPLGVNELAKLSETSPATAFRILQTLKSRGFVRQNSDDKYAPGHKMTFIAAERSLHASLRDIAAPRMAELTADENEAMNLVVREGIVCYILDQSRTSRIVDYVPPIGTRLPFHASACGKVLLAGMPNGIRESFVDSLTLTEMTADTITDKEELLSCLSKIREDGFALDRHESQAEGFCIAVPIAKDADSEPIAALSFSGFIGRRTVDEIDHYTGLLKKAAREISAELFGVYTRKDDTDG